MAERGAEMSGSERAAILLMSLGEEDATAVLKLMDAREVQKVGTAMASLSGVTREQLQQALDVFVDEVDDHTSIGLGADDSIRRILVKAVGPKKAQSLLDRILAGGAERGLEALQWMETRAIARMVSGEHPQIIAILLAHLEAEQAAEVVAGLETPLRNEVLMRVAHLGDVQEEALQELNTLVNRSTETREGGKSASVGGLKVAAEIINSLDGEAESEVMSYIREQDEEMGGQIEEFMFSFEVLLQIDDRGIQTLLREISSEVLTVALKGADPAIQDKIFGNMSKRAAEMLMDDLSVKGPVRVSEVEEAQKEILTTARKLADEGTIMLGGKGEEFV